MCVTSLQWTRLRTRNLKLVYCPTGKMIADYNSKPTQCKLFVDFRNTIMGIKFEYYDRYKKMYEEVLKQYDLFEDENYLYHI